VGFLSWLFELRKSSSPINKGLVHRPETSDLKEQREWIRQVDWEITGIKLTDPVETPLGGKVRCLGCFIPIDYKLIEREFVICGVRLSDQAVRLNGHNVFATRRGEAWLASPSLQNLLELHILPPMIPQLIAKDGDLRRTMWAISLPRLPPTEKQMAFARRLKVEFEEGISRFELGRLIDETLALKKERRTLKEDKRSNGGNR